MLDNNFKVAKKYITYQCNGHNNNSCNAPGFSHLKIENAFYQLFREY